VSPGEPDHPEDVLAWDVYWQMQRLGFEAVYRLKRLDALDDYQRDWLVLRLVATHDAMQARHQAIVQGE
jgi:hypothetical protein